MRRSRNARQYANDALKHTTRDGSAYRDDRLEQQRQRLERRLSWAFQRGDVAGVERIERRLDALADEALGDVEPGRTAGPIERPRW
ncbi:hypothetical protein [Vreelandella salicampi]|uniref:Uncharacterized protein n=1 Tax=Vreelandella salicampi TaxID=1449798 RepID=A0A7Z0LKV2_9GAMM|nr:hypothetical protein [Halomonas salicampi]NYS60825.1 hypothetical protein [Halomonas salicampi]